MENKQYHKDKKSAYNVPCRTIYCPSGPVGPAGREGPRGPTGPSVDVAGGLAYFSERFAITSSVQELPFGDFFQDTSGVLSAAGITKNVPGSVITLTKAGNYIFRVELVIPQNTWVLCTLNMDTGVPFGGSFTYAAPPILRNSAASGEFLVYLDQDAVRTATFKVIGGTIADPSIGFDAFSGIIWVQYVERNANI